MKKTIILSIVLASLMMSSCLHRTVLKMEDHETKKVTTMITLDRKYIFSPNIAVGHAIRFWTCSDQDDQMVCRVECDGETDFDCVGTFIR